MGVVLGKCLKGETDVNNNGVPDNKEIVLLVENYLKNKKQKENKKVLKKILSGNFKNLFSFLKCCQADWREHIIIFY